MKCLFILFRRYKMRLAKSRFFHKFAISHVTFCGAAPYGQIHSIFNIWVANHLMKGLLTVSRRLDKIGLAKSRFSRNVFDMNFFVQALVHDNLEHNIYTILTSFGDTTPNGGYKLTNAIFDKTLTEFER